MSSFDELFHFISHRREKPIVQKRGEMQYIFDIIRDNQCKSYLEIGTAEGDSIFVFSHALEGCSPFISYVDIAEAHTEKYRLEVIDIMTRQKMKVRGIHGCSHYHDNIKEAAVLAPYDVVMIDGGHHFEDVIADAIAYGSMASKYIIFHDICIPKVRKAFDWYVNKQNYKNVTSFHEPIQDDVLAFGYGVIDVR